MNILKLAAAGALSLVLTSGFTLAQDATTKTDNAVTECPDKGASDATKEVSPECAGKMDKSDKPAVNEGGSSANQTEPPNSGSTGGTNNNTGGDAGSNGDGGNNSSTN
jgi:hypothetical protein